MENKLGMTLKSLADITALPAVAEAELPDSAVTDIPLSSWIQHGVLAVDSDTNTIRISLANYGAYSFSYCTSSHASKELNLVATSTSTDRQNMKQSDDVVGLPKYINNRRVRRCITSHHSTTCYMTLDPASASILTPRESVAATSTLPALALSSLLLPLPSATEVHDSSSSLVVVEGEPSLGNISVEEPLPFLTPDILETHGDTIIVGSTSSSKLLVYESSKNSTMGNALFIPKFYVELPDRGVPLQVSIVGRDVFVLVGIKDNTPTIGISRPKLSKLKLIIYVTPPQQQTHETLRCKCGRRLENQDSTNDTTSEILIGESSSMTRLETLLMHVLSRMDSMEKKMDNLERLLAGRSTNKSRTSILELL